MTDRFWKKLDYISGLFPLAAIFGVLVVSANIEIKDLDLWLHLAMGKFISLHHFVPEADVLSCSIQGQPWINHEWLFQVLLYQIYQAFGSNGLITMQVYLASVTMLLLLFLGYNRDRQLLVSLSLFLVYLIYQQRFTIRPDLFSLFFFTVYIFVLSLHIDKRWAVPVLFIVQVLWSNMHGFFFFGPLFVLIGLFSEWVKRNARLPYEWNESGRLTDDEYRRIKHIFLAVLCACVVNPLFVKGAWYPVKVFFSLSGENRIFFDYIQELQPPVTGATLWSQAHYGYYKVMILLSFISFIFNRRRIDISALIFWIVFLVFSLKAVRNGAYFAFAAYLVFITNLLNMRYEDLVPIRFTFPRFQHLTAIILNLGFVLWIFGYSQTLADQGYYDFDRYEVKSEYGGVSQTSYPDKGVDFLVRNQVKGNFFNDFNSGAYLLGKTFPDIRVFIDGRTEVYGGEFFKMYQKIWGDGDVATLERVLEKYQITGALLNSARQYISKEILNYFYSHKEWVLVYFDYDAVIFLKNVEANRPVIDLFSIDLSRWKPSETDMFKIGVFRVKPYRPYYRAYTLESLGFNDAALEELNIAIGVDPFYAEAHDLLGKIYAKKEDYRRAFEHFRIAAMGIPRKKEIRHNLALAYFDLGKYDGAVKQYEMITKIWPKDPAGYFLLAKTHILNGQYDKAVESLEKAHTLDPKAARDLVELGEKMYERKAYTHARQTFSLALQTGKDLGTVHKWLGDTWAAENNVDRAVKEYEAALAVSPNNLEIQNALRGVR